MGRGCRGCKLITVSMSANAPSSSSTFLWYPSVSKS